MEEGRKRWEDMKIDCLVSIFQRLGLDDLILSLPFVCRSWSKATLHPLCWQILDFRSLNFMPFTKLANRFASLYSLTSFSFSSFLKFAVRRSSGSAAELRFPPLLLASCDDLTFVSNECPKLRVLALPNLAMRDEAQIPALVGRWKELELLEMQSKPSCFVQLAAQFGSSCRNFRGLKMSGSIKMEDAAAIVSHMPKIAYLNLSKSYLPKEQLMTIVNGCREIERLIVKECVGFEMDDQEIKGVENNGCRVFEDRGSKIVEDLDYETDECDDALYVCVI